MRMSGGPAGWPERVRALARGELSPVPTRRAATVLLLRDAESGGPPAVHMLRRRTTMAFAGGMYAFPGGGVDPRDERPVRLAGPPLAEWAALLGLEPAAAQAVVCAAVRETFEESGVLLAGPAQAGTPGGAEAGYRADGTHVSGAPGGAGAPGVSGGSGGAEAGYRADGTHVSGASGRTDTVDTAGGVVADTTGAGWEADRAALVRHELAFADFLDRRGLALRSDLLRPCARWVTPEFEERRYDTWFFLAALPAGQRTRDVSGEADRTVWLPAAQAVAGYDRGELAMLPPTITMLRDLLPYGSAAAALAGAAGRDLDPVMATASLDEAGTVVLTWPGHEDFTRVAPAGDGG
jgi:8-oxo-dGTP pyrophosphatase MutT (NUDIX family)